MSHLIRIGGGVSAAALVIALGFAFWPQFDRSLAGGRAPVEKPVFVVRATPVKLAAAIASPVAQVSTPGPEASTPTASAPTTATTTVPQTAAPGTQTDPALSKLAMALRANGSTQPAATPELGATRGLTLASSGASGASEEARRLCAQGLVALAQGSIASARAYLQRAAEAGDARALLALGETYDPVTLARIGARGLKGDAARARDYYAQALAAGLSVARERMAGLNAP
jgi:TPR repeat protein